jgi:Uma2 family endonuclease
MNKTLSPPKKPRSSRTTAVNVAELLRELGDIPAGRVRLEPPPGLATKRDLLRLLERDNIPCELVNGTLVEKAMGQIESSLAVWLAHFLCVYLESRPIGRVFGADAPHELRKKLIRMPDVAFVSHARIPAGDARKKPIAAWAPDLAVEILSKGNTRAEIEMKRREYFDAGVRLVWIVDPRKRTVNVHTSFESGTELSENDVLDGGDVLPGFRLSLRNWFAKVE